jgi:radical SAM-linked protein
MKSRTSPPCGKVAGQLIHHTNLEDAEPDRKRLVCYDCGVACDLSKMREDRLVALRGLGATKRPAAREQPIDVGGELVDVSERGGGSPAERTLVEARRGGGKPRDREPKMERGELRSTRESERAERVRLAGHVGADLPYSTYRIRFAKVGRAAFLGHLDLVRLLRRSFRRADLPLALTRGFSPKPRLAFGPALGLGVPSLGELMDVDLEHAPVGARTWEADAATPRVELAPEEVFERLASVCPPGIEIHGCTIVRLSGHPLAKQPDLGLGKLINAIDVVIRPAADGMLFDAARLDRIAKAFLAKDKVVVARGEKHIEVRGLVSEVEVLEDTRLAAALDWAPGPVLRVRVSSTTEGSAKPSEIAKALGVWGADDPRADHALVARLGVVPVAPWHSTPMSAVTSRAVLD